MSINDLTVLKGFSVYQRNAQYRGKNLGTISSLNEYIAFRSAHGIDDRSYKDLYLGDYFVIQDGTYNVVWMVAHFHYYYNKGEAPNVGPAGIVLIPKTASIETKMNNTNTTEGGYTSSIANATTCPAIATALQRVLGSYLLSTKQLFTTATNNSIPSMAGANWNGASTNWTWTSTLCSLPNEVQVFGCTSLSSSLFDVGEACEKLAVFNFINHVENGRFAFWLRSVASQTSFAVAGATGGANYSTALTLFPIRPLIYIG